jgi:hypothetical protein
LQSRKVYKRFEAVFSFGSEHVDSLWLASFLKKAAPRGDVYKYHQV